MVRAGFGVRMKMPPPLLPPLSGSNPRFSSTTRYIPSRKPRDFFGEPPTALSCVRRPPPPLMSQKPLLPPSALKPRFFPPRDAMNDFPTPLLRMRMTPRIGFGLKRNPVGGPVPRPRLAKMNAPGIRSKSLEFSRFPQTPKAVRTGEVVLKSKKKGKKKKKTYTLTKEKSLKKPWVNETLKTEIEKKFALLEEAKTKNEPPVWNAYLQQKKLVDDINQALRLEYLGNRPDVEVSKATDDDVGVLKSNQNVVTDGDAVVECTENKKDEILENVDLIANIESKHDCQSEQTESSSIS